MKGSYRDGSTLVEWEMPEYSQDDLKHCEKGHHLRSRRRVVNGWIGFSQIERYYCACGSRLWLRYEGTLIDGDKGTEGAPGSHLAWVEGQERLSQ